MEIQVNVNELRTIALLSSEAAERMDTSNKIISTVESKHDWKCPERDRIDNSLETIKRNAVILNNAFSDFSKYVFEMANMVTEMINNKVRDEAGYEDDVVSIICGLMGKRAASIVSGGSNVNSVVSSIEASSLNESNIASLHGSSHGINVIDFSLLRDSN